MKSKTMADGVPSLAQVMPGYQFSEHHSGVIEAPVEQVWDALTTLRWADLSVVRMLLHIRGMGTAVREDGIFETFTKRAGAVASRQPPRRTLVVMVGKPWSMVPQKVQVESLDEITGFDEPGWLKYGMEWVLHPLDGGRTLVETRTLCEATDVSARRRFRAYWTVVRAFSGAVRHAMIAALRRASTPS